MNVSRRALLTGLFGLTMAPEALAGILNLKGKNTAAASNLLSPSSLWTGVAGTGFDPTGINAFPEPSPSTARAAGDPVRPSIQRMVRSFETVDRNLTVGAEAAFSGAAGLPQGLAYVRFDLEGARYTAIAPTDYTLTDVNGTTWPMHLHNFIFDFANTVSRHATGRVKYYMTAFANDPAADTNGQCIGPFYITPRTSYVTAPWDPTGLAIYSNVYKIDKTGAIPGSYLTIALAMQAAATAGSKSPLWAICRDGAHPVATNFQVTGGPSAALEWGTFMCDPTTVATGAWIGDGTATSNFAPRWDGLQVQGFLFKLDSTLIGTGFRTFGPGSTFTSLCINGIDMYQGAGTSPSFTGWCGVSGAGALFNGLIPSLNCIASSATNVQWLEVDIHDIIYGIANGIARNCIGRKSFKFHQNVKGSYNCTIYETGGYNNPNLVPMDAIAVWYTGAASVPAVYKAAANGIAGSLLLVEDGVTKLAIPIGTTDTLTSITSQIAAQADWNATLIATTPDISRNPVYLWYGTLGTTPPSQGIRLGTSGTTPLPVSKSSGAPTVLQTIQDAHSDNSSVFGTRPPPVQNYIQIGFSSWGAKGAQTFFLDRSADFADVYLGSSVFHDVTYLSPPLLDFASGFGGICSNVVEEYVTATGTGASRAFYSGVGGNPYVGDKYCKHHSTYYDGAYSASGTSQLSLVQFQGIASKADVIATAPFGGSTQGVPDSNSFFLGTATNVNTIFVEPIGVAPYGYRGAGTKPDLSPLTPTILRMPVSLATCGAFAYGGARQLAA